MADVGDELLAGALQLFQTGQVVKHEDGAATVGDGGGVDLQPALVQSAEFQFVAVHLFFRRHFFQQFRQFVLP